MDDLTITRLCAEAMGLAITPPIGPDFTNGNVRYLLPNQYHEEYNPLHDDAQCMALVKEFNLEIRRGKVPDGWLVTTKEGWRVSEKVMEPAWDKDLNRAVCETVAKMQLAKEPKQ